MSNRKLIKKTIYAIKVRFCSPISVSSGRDEFTDSDVMRNLDGDPFVPGSALAGACRNYLDLLKDQDGFMGYAKDNDGAMSRLLFTDMEIQNPDITNRDGVGLQDDKQVDKGAKFDFEVIDTGATGVFKLELVTREYDEDVSDTICTFLRGIENGEVSIGKKKTRGYGCMKIEYARIKEFNKKNIEEYANAYTLTEEDIQKWDDVEWRKEQPDYQKYIKLTVPLKNKGCISIRQYQAEDGEPDYIHIKSNKIPVIPGTSFAGAIRSRTKAILKEAMGNALSNEVEALINEVCGYVNKEKKTAQQSSVIFRESVIEGAHDLTISRTAISRFESSAKDKALYQETTCIGGTLKLEILIKKSIATRVVPLLMPTILDLQAGYLPVGGLVSIGRGILAPDGEVEIEGNESIKWFQPENSEDGEKTIYRISDYSLESVNGERGDNDDNHK